MNLKRTLSKLLCLCLCLCFVIEVIPPDAYAVSIDELEQAAYANDPVYDTEDGGYATPSPKEITNLDDVQSNDNDSEVSIVKELTESRSAHGKQFLLSDGSIAAVSYAMDVNYLDEHGEWKEINNNFQYTQSEDDFTGLETLEGSVTFKFAETRE